MCQISRKQQFDTDANLGVNMINIQIDPPTVTTCYTVKPQRALHWPLIHPFTLTFIHQCLASAQSLTRPSCPRTLERVDYKPSNVNLAGGCTS